MLHIFQATHGYAMLHPVIVVTNFLLTDQERPGNNVYLFVGESVEQLVFNLGIWDEVDFPSSTVLTRCSSWLQMLTFDAKV